MPTGLDGMIHRRLVERYSFVLEAQTATISTTPATTALQDLVEVQESGSGLNSERNLTADPCPNSCERSRVISGDNGFIRDAELGRVVWRTQGFIQISQLSR